MKVVYGGRTEAAVRKFLNEKNRIANEEKRRAMEAERAREEAVRKELELQAAERLEKVIQAFREIEVMPARMSMKSIVIATCEEFGVEMNDMLSKRRAREIVIPRHVAMWRCRKLTDRSYPEIGRFFDRDHTVPMFAKQKIDSMISEGRIQVSLIPQRRAA